MTLKGSAVFLSKHAFFSVNRTEVIFLDLKADRYLALDLTSAAALGGVVQGWPPGSHRPDEPKERSHGTDNSIVNELIIKGLLTTDRAQGKDAAASPATAPVHTLLAPPSVNHRELTPRALGLSSRHVAAFLVSVSRSSIQLRWSRLEQTVEKVAERRGRLSNCHNGYDCEHARTLVQIFDWLRPLAFTARDACLFDSLALINFLAYFKIFPHWVFGVQSAPFSAHCWVQENDVVFNDTVDHVATYSPIMVI
jgi:hypothetical protein